MINQTRSRREQAPSRRECTYPAQESFVMEPILGEIRRSYYSYIISGMALVHDNRWRTLLGT